MSADPDVALLQTALAAEHAAIHGYGVLGARLPASTRRRALLAVDSHRVRRDQLAARIIERGGEPVVSLPAYDVRAVDAAAALALAVRLEDGMGVRWRDLVTGTDDPALRRLGVAGLSETAVRAAGWRELSGAATVTRALPGLP